MKSLRSREGPLQRQLARFFSYHSLFMKEEIFCVFTQFQSPFRGAHYLLRESLTNIEKLAEKKALMKPDLNVRYAYSWIYMVTEPIDSPSVNFFKTAVDKLKLPKRQIRVS